jgi:hypothetical protein
MESARVMQIENELESILRTLESFDVVPAGVSGAILYPARQTDPELPLNLRAAAAASTLGLSSLDHVKKAYPPEPADLSPRPVVEAYSKACRLARMHMADTRADLASGASARKGTKATVGAVASSVALQRLSSGFLGAQLLYRVGLNIEGDAVARQILEQISWAMEASELNSLKAIEALQPQSSIATLKRLLPEAGRLNGALSKVTHAGIAVHRSVVERAMRGHQVLIAQERLSRAADIVLTLADAWVLACEFTQRDHISGFRALMSRDDPTPDQARTFLAERARAVNAIAEFEVD